MNQPPQGWGGPPQSQYGHPPQYGAPPPGQGGPGSVPKKWTTGKKLLVGGIVLGCSFPILLIGGVQYMYSSGRWKDDSKERLAEARAACKPPNVFRRKLGYEHEKPINPDAPGHFECVSEAEFNAHAIDEAKEQSIAKIIPWWDEMHGYCMRYHGVKNEIKKSEVFNEYNAHVEKVGKLTFEGVPAKVTRIDTPRGGGVASVSFRIKDAFDINTSYYADSPLWSMLSELDEGAWVLISATEVAPVWGITEESHVCPEVYSGKVSKIVSDVPKK